MTTYAVYQETADGLARIGTFSGPKGSVRSVCASLKAKMPEIVGTKVYVSVRRMIEGKWVDDSQRIPCDWN